MMFEVLLVLMTLLHSSSQSCTVTATQTNIFTRIGDEVKLVCSADSEKKFCSFRSPTGTEYTMNSEFDSDDRFRAFKTDNFEKDCAMKITNVKENDNGQMP